MTLEQQYLDSFKIVKSNKNGTYNFVYKGIGTGPTTVTINNFSADVETPIVSYTDMPTTTSTTANFTVQSASPEDTRINIDTNNDGALDEIIPADGTDLSLNELISLLKTKVSNLNVKDKIKQNIFKQISNLEKKIENKKQKNIKILASLKNKISKQELKGKINTGDTVAITDLLDLLEAQSDSTSLDSTALADLKVKIQSLNIKQNLKNDLLKRVSILQNKQAIIKNLSNLSKNINKKSQKEIIPDMDAQTILDLLNQIESVI
jgi:hypothetical protein